MRLNNTCIGMAMIYVETNNNVTVVIRACAERTLAACCRMVETQVGKEQVVVVSEVPFAKALRSTYRVGIEKGREWTLAVDADVLICSRAVSDLLGVAREMPEHVFAVQGQQLDKFFNGPRPGGLRLYRTAFLLDAVKCIPPVGTAKRPESHAMGQMAVLGLPTLEIEQVLGLHDYEQWHRDTYRKAFFHGHKFAAAVHTYWGSMWQRLAEDEEDYQVALLGMEAGLACDQDVTSDVTQFSSEAVAKVLQDKGFSEKAALAPQEITSRRIHEIIDAHVPPREYWSWRLLKHPDTRSDDGMAERYRRTLARTGWLGLGPYAAGRVMTCLGSRLQALAKRG